MTRLLLLKCFLFLSLLSNANTIVVKNIDDLNEANKKAVAGDIIILQSGEWKNVVIKLDCRGTKEKPITFKSQNAGKVLITGNSRLMIGGNYIVIDGLYFTNGYSGEDAVITYRIDNKQLANNCRVTNTVIDNFNNPKRMDENYWVAFYGKNNELDHCTFIEKTNIGVLLAVILDDERSRENFHLINHNYFGKRPPLGSNGGEIIRVGVSQHCQFNSNTSITKNLFEQCDGETEIVSIKSCANKVEDNVFKECQGSVVLRHGDNNLVADNYFLGNDKPGSGGVRVINKGQKVIHNIFYKCRGVDFRSPLAIMNGIPNSPANRYVQVTDAQITDNNFYECSPITLGEGSDTERTLPPDNVIIAKNKFYNSRDSIIYKVYDDISGIKFSENEVSSSVRQSLVPGISKIKMIRKEPFFLPNNETLHSGAPWFNKKPPAGNIRTLTVRCSTAEEVYKQLQKNNDIIIHLTGSAYTLDRPFIISKNVQFVGDKKTPLKFTTRNVESTFIISSGALMLRDLIIDGKNVKSTHFISSDSSGYSNHYALTISNCSIREFNKENGCQSIFYTYQHTFADSIKIHNTSFINNNCNFLIMNDEKEDKGYYNAEKIFIGHNNFTAQTGVLINIYRGGNDESTLGPMLSFSHNKLNNCNTSANDPLIRLTGVQFTNIFSNNFSGCNFSGSLITYMDRVRARHNLEKNTLSASGRIEANQFVTEKNNLVK